MPPITTAINYATQLTMPPAINYATHHKLINYATHHKLLQKELSSGSFLNRADAHRYHVFYQPNEYQSTQRNHQHCILLF